MAFQWVCPYCNHYATITSNNNKVGSVDLEIKNAKGLKKTYVNYIVCPNPECKELTLFIELYEGIESNFSSLNAGRFEKSWNLIPQSSAKVLPDYIPKAIIDDYNESCIIKDLSPKASATLSRRCLQGMIRDFWGVVEKRLIDEIEGIKDKVDPLTWEAINAVRKIGNIGAHMESDINVIIDVDPNEAGLLIQLIETLIDDWYITRHERKKRLQDIIQVKNEKESTKKK